MCIYYDINVHSYSWKFRKYKQAEREGKSLVVLSHKDDHFEDLGTVLNTLQDGSQYSHPCAAPYHRESGLTLHDQ